MKDLSRSNRECSPTDIKVLITTPPRLLAADTSRGHPLSPRDIQNGRTKSASPVNPFKNWDIISSSDDDLPDLADFFKGTTKIPKETTKDSDDEYDLPSEFEITPRKIIRIAALSDDD
jgi:hypothetical protein